MSSPSVEVLGVYRLPVTDEMVAEQIEAQYGGGLSRSDRQEAEQQCLEQLASVALIEALVRHCDERFDIGDFTQPVAGAPRDDWQAAWAEVFLSLEGDDLAVEDSLDAPEVRDVRLAFYLHEWQEGVPLQTTYGDVPCPPVQPMPERLAMLAPYEPVD